MVQNGIQIQIGWKVILVRETGMVLLVVFLHMSLPCLFFSFSFLFFLSLFSFFLFFLSLSVGAVVAFKLVRR